MITTPDTEQRRERYVDAILAALARDTSRGPNWHAAADAAMAVADQEQRAHAAEVRAAALTDHERQFLTFALDLAFDRMVSEDGFTDEDDAALESLRRMAAAAHPDDTTGA